MLWYYPCVVLCFSVSQKLENGAQQATRLLVITFVPLFVLPPTLPYLRRIYIPPFLPLPFVVCKDTFLVLMPQFFSVIICCLWMCAVLCLSVTPHDDQYPIFQALLFLDVGLQSWWGKYLNHWQLMTFAVFTRSNLEHNIYLLFRKLNSSYD